MAISYIDLAELMSRCEDNDTVRESFEKAYSVLSRYGNANVGCSISGGADSDRVLDIVTKFDPDKRIKYVWFDTGLEYQATKQHLKYLESKYDITIERWKTVTPIPYVVRKYGQPFISKTVSEMIARLQKYNFKFEDKSYEELMAEYSPNGRGCSGALGWWCNKRDVTKYGYSMFNINYHRYLKEFMVANPPWFPISNKCCDYTKKLVAADFIELYDIDLMITGIRKAEKGIRSAAYDSCYDQNTNEHSNYRPLFWYQKDDIEFYDRTFGVKHSDCYEKYGMTRTGCVGCPYNKHVTDELDMMRLYEPQLVKACENVFPDAYKYTVMFHEYIAEQKKTEKKLKIMSKYKLSVTEEMS